MDHMHHAGDDLRLVQMDIRSHVIFCAFGHEAFGKVGVPFVLPIVTLAAVDEGLGLECHWESAGPRLRSPENWWSEFLKPIQHFFIFYKLYNKQI